VAGTIAEAGTAAVLTRSTVIDAAGRVNTVQGPACTVDFEGGPSGSACHGFRDRVPLVLGLHGRGHRYPPGKRIAPSRFGVVERDSDSVGVLVHHQERPVAVRSQHRIRRYQHISLRIVEITRRAEQQCSASFGCTHS
jgi:hypothetical protein